MGGEPTFVSIDDMTSPQWTVAADGPEKRELANRAGRPRWPTAFAPGGLVQHSQGKWYPGRAAAALADRPALAGRRRAAVERPGAARRPVRRGGRGRRRAGPRRGPGPGDHRRLRAAGRASCGRASRTRWPRWPPRSPSRTGRGRARPAIADPDLVAELDRAEPARSPGRCRWCRPGAATAGPARAGGPAAAGSCCVPGDSAGRAAAAAGLAVLDGPRLRRRGRATTGPATDAGRRGTAPQRGRGRPGRDRRPGRRWWSRRGTASCTSSCRRWRAGEVRRADRAARPGRRATPAPPVVLEGYGPPPDPRLTDADGHPGPRRDRGQPAPDRELGRAGRAHRRRCTRLARELGLGTETFATRRPAQRHRRRQPHHPRRRRAGQSPLLRRPDLLVSLLTYWQHHPSLSYLFSGRFVGPTSQAPRVDEGRPETLYELEIAFAEIDRLADRTDDDRSTGPGWSTGRCGTCSPTSPATPTAPSSASTSSTAPTRSRGRLGLLELRGFEMPPHPDMALVQALLVRALVARFAEEPYSAPLVRWGTALHERFLLPHFAMADLAEVVADLRAHDLDFDLAWLDPYLEFRFPRIGGRPTVGRRRAGAAVGDRAVARARARRPPPAAPPATSTPRPSGCRCASRGFDRRPARCSPATASPVPLTADRHAGAATSPASATGPGSRGRRCTRRWRSTPR